MIDHRNPRLPTWLRVALYAETRQDRTGHARLFPEELRTSLGIAPWDASRAIRTAVSKNLLDPMSSARCLVIAGAKPSPCKATHRTKP